MFGVYDNIGILGFPWQRAAASDEEEEDGRMMTQDKHDMEKRIRFLYRHFKRFGKHR
uniref:Uncharacterized protein n=1 Tax=Oncorhynchus tshawytscha TaxID=74940 RepID=A0AAZ3RF00_ONCTS